MWYYTMNRFSTLNVGNAKNKELGTFDSVQKKNTYLHITMYNEDNDCPVSLVLEFPLCWPLNDAEKALNIEDHFGEFFLYCRMPPL